MKIDWRLGIIAILACGECFIIPEELPSLLSLIYSNIPPVKKGTDSRIGLGFRLGPHADFQVLLELGPQTNTDPLNMDTGENQSKRQVLVMKNTQTLVDYMNRLTNYFNPNKKKDKISDTPGGKWMDWWKNNVMSQNEIGKIEFTKVPGIDDIRPESSENVVLMAKDPSNQETAVVNHLKQLYKTQPKKS